MTRDVQLVAPDDTVQEIARLMADVAAGAVPVGRDGRPEGIVTDRDIIIRVVSEARDAAVTTAQEIMSRDILTCREEEDADVIGETMRTRQIRRMVVVDAEGRTIGIVTLSDVGRRYQADRRSHEEVIQEAAGDKPGYAPINYEKR